MPVTQLDEHAALLVIDLQKGIARLPMLHASEQIVGRAAELVRAFRKRGQPVVLVNVTGIAPGRTEAVRPRYEFPPDWAELVTELDQQPEDLLISKKRVGAFIGTDLDAKLRERGVTQVFLCGIATSAGVESTGRSAYDLGYHVVYIVDAMTDRDAASHGHSAEKVFPRFGETDTTENVLKLLGN